MNEQLEKDEDEFFNIPVYQVVTKDAMLGGLPFNMFILVGAGAFIGLALFNSLKITLFFLIIYVILLLLIKFSPKFDVKIIDILTKMNFQKYLDY